ncbi:MAG: hypothetical protein HRT38_05955 [Alteromonadaceae bacterium]|nr:hypothetical protein [Alteromonadaceae bacterium]
MIILSGYYGFNNIHEVNCVDEDVREQYVQDFMANIELVKFNLKELL